MLPRNTTLSPCRRYRYTLWREWEPDTLESYLMVIGLNPSTADETADDPTIRKCMGFAKRWGFGALCMTNLFAWRDTKPENMKKAEFPEGTDNQHHILRTASEAGMVLCAWGNHGAYRHAGLNVIQWLDSIDVQPRCLGRNADGSPKHPLYVPYSVTPARYSI